MADIKDRLRPLLQTFTRPQLIACFRMSRLPRGDLRVPEWIFAVAELGRDPQAIDALLGAVGSLTRQPSFAEVMVIAEVTRELNRVVAEISHRRRNGPTPRFGLRRGPRTVR